MDRNKFLIQEEFKDQLSHSRTVQTSTSRIILKLWILCITFILSFSPNLPCTYCTYPITLYSSTHFGAIFREYYI